MIKGATIIPVESNTKFLLNHDILIENDLIKAIGPNLSPPDTTNITTINAQNHIITPGFTDPHYHLWQHPLRALTTDFSLYDYCVHLRSIYGTLNTPNDIYFSNYTAALSLINNGVTSVLDNCHVINLPRHADYAVRGLKDAGISELAAIRESGAGVVSTPDTEMQMGMGNPGSAVFRAGDGGCRVESGLDITSNQGCDMLAQMRLALQMQRALENSNVNEEKKKKKRERDRSSDKTLAEDNGHPPNSHAWRSTSTTTRPDNRFTYPRQESRSLRCFGAMILVPRLWWIPWGRWCFMRL